jgi:hypothetical protein
MELSTQLLVGLLVLLAAAPEASPQTAQSGPPTRQVSLRKPGKLGNNGSSPATGATPGAMPGLCFQPGVGWQSILPEPPGARATPDTNSPIGLEVSSSTSVAHAQSIYSRSSSVKQAHVAECAGISTNKKVLGAGIEKFTILNRPGTIRSAGSTKPGMVTSRHAHSPLPVPTNFASEAELDGHPDQAGVRNFHAYISSIKLRRLIRNAPDFRTRITLQQLQNNPANQLHKAKVVSKTGALARRPLQGEPANRTSSSRSNTHDRPREKPRTLFSGAYR